MYGDLIPKITFNSLKTRRTKTGRLIFVWRQPKGKGKKPSKVQIKQFRTLRSKAAKKREIAKVEFRERFKFHQTRSKNIEFTSYCKGFNNGKGIVELQKLFKSLGLEKKIGKAEPGKIRIRFYTGSFRGSDPSGECPERLFIAHTKTDKYRLAREMKNLTNNNFEDKYINYLIGVMPEARGAYRRVVCPEINTDGAVIEWLAVCFQVIKIIR